MQYQKYNKKTRYRYRVLFSCWAVYLSIDPSTRFIKPKFKKMAAENPNAYFVLVDAEKNPASRKLANVDNLPTFAGFKQGAFVNQVQTNKLDVLQSFVNEVTDN